MTERLTAVLSDEDVEDWARGQLGLDASAPAFVHDGDALFWRMELEFELGRQEAAKLLDGTRVLNSVKERSPTEWENLFHSIDGRPPAAATIVALIAMAEARGESQGLTLSAAKGAEQRSGLIRRNKEHVLSLYEQHTRDDAFGFKGDADFAENVAEWSKHKDWAIRKKDGDPMSVTERQIIVYLNERKRLERGKPK